MVRNIRTSVVIMMMAIMMMSATACSYKKNIEIIQQDPMAELLYARQTFHDVVSVVSSMEVAGKFNKSEVLVVKGVMNNIDDYLNQWQVDIIEGKERPGALDFFKVKMYDLLIYQWGQ